jgi:hypothetical protein
MNFSMQGKSKKQMLVRCKQKKKMKRLQEKI